MTLIEKILASHSKNYHVKPGDIVDIIIDVRVARDFGGANVIKNIRDHNLTINDPQKTLFTFDCNPTGSDQKYAVNQHICRLFARENGIRVYDIETGIGTHILIDEGYVAPGFTAVSTDSHANILGAIGAFGQGMGDMDIAASWNTGKIWFRVPPSVKITFTGDIPPDISAKDFILNLLGIFGANRLLGFSIELYGKCIDRMTLDQRITIASMATEMGAIIILFPPSQQISAYCREKCRSGFTPFYADTDAAYEDSFEIDVSGFRQLVSKPGAPHDVVGADQLLGTRIDSAFIGSCTNGRMDDMRKAAEILNGKKTAPGVVLKIVPSTDAIWKRCLDEGLINIFKSAGALVSNAGCAGCAAGQVGQNGPGEVTISTGNRNFPGKQGKGNVYLASPEIAAASAIAGHITTPDRFTPDTSGYIHAEKILSGNKSPSSERKKTEPKPEVLEGKVWLISKDNIDTDMIFHNKYLSVTDIREMGQYAFDNLEGYNDFAGKAQKGDMVVAGKNFGSGSSRQQAVDCFLSLGISAIIAESFGAIYERNAINAALPVISCKSMKNLGLKNGDTVRIDMRSGTITNCETNISTGAEPVSDVQLEIYRKGGLLA